MREKSYLCMKFEFEKDETDSNLASTLPRPEGNYH
jgi:hypothetical protein